MDPQPSSHRFSVTVIGQEGDQAPLEVEPNEPCQVLLQQGLHKLYGEPGPNPDGYDAVLSGKIIDPLSQTVSQAGITAGAEVSILPKSISRGARRWPSARN